MKQKIKLERKKKKKIRKRKGEKMKIDIKCYEFLTNKGNGKKCKLAPLVNCRHQDCPFKTNGLIETSTLKVKIRYVYSLANRCKEWHENKKQNKHYSKVIEPQIEKICDRLEKKTVRV